MNEKELQELVKHSGETEWFYYKVCIEIRSFYTLYASADNYQDAEDIVNEEINKPENKLCPPYAYQSVIDNFDPALLEENAVVLEEGWLTMEERNQKGLSNLRDTYWKPPHVPFPDNLKVIAPTHQPKWWIDIETPTRYYRSVGFTPDKYDSMDEYDREEDAIDQAINMHGPHPHELITNIYHHPYRIGEIEECEDNDDFYYTDEWRQLPRRTI